MAQKYAFVGYDEEKMARALGTSLPISTKVAVEICNYLRRRPLQRVKAILEAVVAMKEAIPYRRFNMDVGHKPGMAAGRYPVKACTAILALVKSAEANAQFKGLHSSNLYLVHVCAHKAARPMRYGRQRGRQAKRTHVEVVLQERVAKKKEPKQSQSKLAQKKDVEVKSAPEPVVKQEAEKEKVAAEKVTESKPEVKKELPQQDPKETQPEQSSAKPNNKPVQEPGPSQEAKQE